jgi:hypothetical protein
LQELVMGGIPEPLSADDRQQHPELYRLRQAVDGAITRIFETTKGKTPLWELVSSVVQTLEHVAEDANGAKGKH